ncbi:hypothetical protein OPV22_016137 [Ensete ventricosum]|uniref:Uncharacterized protein n=1 Tax=Ensete ventricosum TaxID=4639 RepID=A0AAV8QV37_ENSVE|nr:hypothetical protein OPV22_016137 [Ensete ventricosum]
MTATSYTLIRIDEQGLLMCSPLIRIGIVDGHELDDCLLIIYGFSIKFQLRQACESLGACKLRLFNSFLPELLSLLFVLDSLLHKLCGNALM